MTSRSFRSLALVAACVALCGWSLDVAHAQDARDPNRNNRPFFARGALGVGYVGLSSVDTKNDLTIDHVGMYWDLAVGAKVWRELSLHATYFGGWAWEPEVKVDGKNIPGQHGSERSLAVLGVGPGVTYHLLPLNMYLSYSVGLGWSVLQFHENKAYTPPGWSNFGFANEVMLGKEWWIGGGMAIGGAVQALFARVKDDDGVKYNSFGGSILLSATYH